MTARCESRLLVRALDVDSGEEVLATTRRDREFAISCSFEDRRYANWAN